MIEVIQWARDTFLDNFVVGYIVWMIALHYASRLTWCDLHLVGLDRNDPRGCVKCWKKQGLEHMYVYTP